MLYVMPFSRMRRSARPSGVPTPRIRYPEETRSGAPSAVEESHRQPMPHYKHLHKGADFELDRRSWLEPLHPDLGPSFEWQTQVQCQGENRVGFFIRRSHRIERRARDLKAFMTPDFGLGVVDWTGCVKTAIGWSNMVSALANQAISPAIDKVEDERRMHRNRGVQGRRQAARTIPYACDRGPGFVVELKRHTAPITGNDIAGLLCYT